MIPFNTRTPQDSNTAEVSVQSLLQKLDIIEKKLNSTTEPQPEILERFLKETEPLEDEIEAIENKEELITGEELRVCKRPVG